MKDHNKKFLTIILALLCIILLLSIFSLVLRFKKPSSTKPPTKPKITPTKPAPSAKEKGSLTLKAENDQTILSQKDPIILYLYADSDNQPVNGYDAVINYDSTKVDFVSYKNLQTDFQVFTKKEENKLMITGIKNLKSTNPTVFADTPLVKLTFKGKQTGQIKFSLEYTPESKRDSNLISDKTADILGKVEGVKISIGQQLNLIKNQPKAVADGEITLKVVEIIKPDDKCRDCITSVKVEVEKDGQTKEIEFKTGGFAGYLIDKQEAFGYFFKLTQVKQNNISLVWISK